MTIVGSGRHAALGDGSRACPDAIRTRATVLPVVEHVEEQSVLFGVGLVEEASRSDDRHQRPLQRAGGEVLGEARRLFQPDFQMISALARLPRDRGIVIAAAREAGTAATDELVERLEKGEPMPGNRVMSGWQKCLQARSDGSCRDFSRDDVDRFDGGRRAVFHLRHALKSSVGG